jgi:hypothetical protein
MYEPPCLELCAARLIRSIAELQSESRLSGHSAHRLTEWALLRLGPFDRLVDRREHLVVELGPQPCQALALPPSDQAADPSPAENLTCCPRACGTTRMSENRIAASNPNRRTGCSVASAASFGLNQSLRKSPAFFDIPADNGRLAASAKPVATYMVACTRSVWDLPPHQPGRRCA